MLEFQSFGGVGKWVSATDTDYVEPDNSKFVLINATSATAKAPFSIVVDSDNLTGNALQILGGASSDKNWLQVVKNTADTEGCQVIIDGSNVAGVSAKPSLRIGSAETGFSVSGTSDLRISINASHQWTFGSNIFNANFGAGPALVNETVTATNPSILPHKTDLNTGIGWAGADNPCIVSGGLESARFEDPADLGATETTLWIYDLDNAQIEQVTVGAADSGGAGFKVLRIAN